MKQPLRFARHLRLIVVAYLMFTSDFTVVAQQTPSALTGRKTISGIVLDIETDQPIVGAQVWLKDTTIGSTTNSSGRFEISFQGNYTVLNVSFLGYETREIVFTPGNAPKSLLPPNQNAICSGVLSSVLSASFVTSTP